MRTLYGLIVCLTPIDTKAVQQFAIGDLMLDDATVSAKAPSRDFVWMGDFHPDAWKAGHSDMVVGHYQPMNNFDDGEYPAARRTRTAWGFGATRAR